MTEQQLLLASIIRNPDGDTERLVYADWLDEHGNENAAWFIRKQISPGYVRDWSDGEPRIRSGQGLLQTAEQQVHHNLVPPLRLIGWGGTMVCYSAKPEGETIRRVDVLFSRGFAHQLECTADDFLKHAESLIWHEGATDECDLCDGKGYIEIDCRPRGGPEFGPQKVYVMEPPVSVRHGCQACGGDMLRNGTGRVPRPCPLTAHPIRRVVLTTPPTPEMIDAGAEFDGRFTWNLALWPGVDFERSGKA